MQLLSTERVNQNRHQLNLQETVSELHQSLQSEQQAAEGKVLIFLCYISGVIITSLPTWTFPGVEPRGFCQMKVGMRLPRSRLSLSPPFSAEE